MNYREIEILAPKDLGASGTEVIDITLSDVLSGIELIWQTTVATISDMLASHAACISRVELLDGSDVLCSLSGEQIQALCYYSMGYMPLDEIAVVVGAYMRSCLPIFFGRYLFDPELGLDPRKFKNLQLRVTWDEDAANTTVAVNELTVRGWAFDEKVATPSGFLMAKEIKAWTPAANGYEYTDMPMDYTYRLLMMQSKSTDKNPFEVLNQLKLSEDNDKRIPIDMTGYEIFRKICQQGRRIFQTVRLNEAAADAMALHLTPTYDLDAQVAYDGDVIAAADDWTQPTFAGRIVTIAASVAVVPYRALVSGFAPHFALAIPFGNLQDINDWYRLVRAGNLRLTTQGASAVGTTPQANIVLQQLRTY